MLFRVGISEFCLYWVHPENPEWTCFEQKADLDIKNFFGFEGTAEKLAIKEYSKSIGKSKDIMEHYINVLADEGITRCTILTISQAVLLNLFSATILEKRRKYLFGSSNIIFHVKFQGFLCKLKEFSVKPKEFE